MYERPCPECGQTIAEDTIFESIDSFDDRAPGAKILLGECYNEKCDAVGLVSLGYSE